MTAQLRRWTVGDAPALHAAVRESPDLLVQLGGADLTRVVDCEAVIDTRLAVWGPAGFHVAISVDGTAVGNVGLSSVERRHGTAWTSYWLTAGVRGQGLAGRALATVAGWAFGELDLFRLELGHRVNNPASCRVATGAGFLAEGLERSKLRYGNDRYDVETHARLTTDPYPVVAVLPLDVSERPSI